MVLESLITPADAEKRPWQMMFLGFIFTLAGIILGYLVFRGQASIVAVFFTAMASIPLIYNTLKLEEEKDEKEEKESVLLKEHFKALEVFMFLFIGSTIAFSFVFIVSAGGFPEIHTKIFKVQADTISAINGKVVVNIDNALGKIGLDEVTGNASSTSHFFDIVINNIKVCLYCVFFSLLYGVGAIFILTWNASVIGAAIGSFIVTNMSALGLSGVGAFGSIAATTKVYSCGFFIRYFPHGFPEIASYFVAAIAGGILSVAIIKHKFGTKKFENIMIDCALLILIALFLVLISGIIEVYFTPALFNSVCI